MKICVLCKKEIEIDKYFSRKAICPKCGGDLHICLNCRFYSESSHNKCLEPKAEFQRARDKANFCDYFVFIENSHPHSDGFVASGDSPRRSEVKRRKENSVMPSADKEKEDARKRLEELFKK